jgi:hypothetical protein
VSGKSFALFLEDTHKVQHLILKRKPQPSVTHGWRLGIQTNDGAALSDYRVNVEHILLTLQVQPHYL